MTKNKLLTSQGLKILSATCLGILTMSAIFIQFHLTQLTAELSSANSSLPFFVVSVKRFLELGQSDWPLNILTVLLILYFYILISKDLIQMNVAILITSFAFSVVNTLGIFVYRMASVSIAFENGQQTMMTLLVFVGNTVLFYSILNLLFRLLDRKTLIIAGSQLLDHTNKLIRFYEKNTFTLSFAAILLFRAPWLIAFYPGSITVDALSQLNQIFGYFELTNHHPVFISVLLGLCMKIGQFVANDNLGLFLYTLLQTIVLSGGFAYAIFCAKRFGLSRRFQLGMIIFFALLPIWGVFSESVVKDVLYTGLIVVFVSMTAKLVSGSLTRELKLYAMYGVVGLLVCLTRNNGIYIILPTLILVALFVKAKHKVTAKIIIILPIILYLLLQSVAMPVLDIASGRKSEALSLPFQQTARYVRDYMNEVTKEEEDSINQVLEYDKLGELYAPGVSDPIKATYKIAGSDEETKLLLDYMKTWASMMLKHPGTYLSAAIESSYGYYAFTNIAHNRYAGMSFYFSITTNERFNRGYFDLQMMPQTKSVRFVLEQIAVEWRHVPILGLLYECEFYTWLTIACGVYLLSRRRWSKLIPMVPVFLSILVCLLSPVNDSFRYFMPVAASLPLVIAVAAADMNSKRSD